jgi:hypothetical protein
MAKLWKKPRCPDPRMDHEIVVYIRTIEYYSATGNNDMGFDGK